MPIYYVTAIVPFSMTIEANTVEHATTKALLLIEQNAVLIVPVEAGKPSMARVTDIKEIKEDEQ
jgi:hypothetical protein